VECLTNFGHAVKDISVAVPWLVDQAWWSTTLANHISEPQDFYLQQHMKDVA
jgi:hypothetical protein